jgi:hypothetical protein
MREASLYPFPGVLFLNVFYGKPNFTAAEMGSQRGGGVTGV